MQNSLSQCQQRGKWMGTATKQQTLITILQKVIYSSKDCSNLLVVNFKFKDDRKLVFTGEEFELPPVSACSLHVMYITFHHETHIQRNTNDGPPSLVNCCLSSPQHQHASALQLKQNVQLVGQVLYSPKQAEIVVVLIKRVWLIKVSCALCARSHNRTILDEILDQPLM